MATGLHRRGDHWVLPCDGLIVVGQVRLDYAYGLEFTETPERAADVAWRLRVQTPFTLHNSQGNEHHLDPEGPQSDSLQP